MKKIIYTSFLLGSFSFQAFSQAGALDVTFSGDGRVVTPIGAATEQGNAVAVQSDGKIVVAGVDGEATVNNNFVVIRYNTDGTLDGSFGTGGISIIDFAGDDDRAYAIAIQADGKILAGGSCNVGPDPSMGLIRLNTNGNPDSTFDGDGRLSFNYGTTNDWISALAVQPDGKIVAAGSKSSFTTGDFLVVRFNSDGTLDTGFNGSGFTVWDIGGDDFCDAMILQPDGKILLGGTTGDVTSDTDFCLARLNSDGSQDSGFGAVISNLGSTTEEIMSLSLQADGKIIAGGYRHNGSDYDFAALRYLSTGSLDNTFDSDGTVYYAVGANDDVCRGTAVQPDGKIILGGTMYTSAADFAVVRLNANGSLDNTFDTDGKVTTDFSGGSFDDAFGMALQSDGKIILAGSSQTSTTDVAVARYNAAGSVDVPELAELSLFLFPDPASDRLMIRNTGEDSEFGITDITGKEVYRGKCNASETVFDCSALPKGYYLLNYYEGNKVLHSKFAKQ